MVDDMRDFDDLEFEGLFRAFDGVTASDALKSRTLAAIAAENATPAIERTQVRPVVSLPQTEDLRAEHMRRPVKRAFRPLHIAVGSAMALLIVAIVGATCWFYPAATVRVEQDDMVVDLGVNVFGACISASAEGEQGEAVLMAEDIRNLSREEAESRLMRRFERMRKDGDFNGAYESTSETTDTTSYTGGKNYGESDQGVAASEQETTQTVSNVEVGQQQPNNLQQQEKPPVNNGQQRQQGGTPPSSSETSSNKASNSATSSRVRRDKTQSVIKAKTKARGSRSRMATDRVSLRRDNLPTIVAWEEILPRARNLLNNRRKASRPEQIGDSRRPRIPVSSLVREVRDPLLVGPLASREWKAVAA